MGAIYTEAQKDATRRYVNSTDQIRVRTEKGNLDFIKAHAEAMGETMGEFINRAISEAIRMYQVVSFRIMRGCHWKMNMKTNC